MVMRGCKQSIAALGLLLFICQKALPQTARPVEAGLDITGTVERPLHLPIFELGCESTVVS